MVKSEFQVDNGKNRPKFSLGGPGGGRPVQESKKSLGINMQESLSDDFYRLRSPDGDSDSDPVGAAAFPIKVPSIQEICVCSTTRRRVASP